MFVKTSIEETVNTAIDALLEDDRVRERGYQLVEVITDRRPPLPGETSAPARSETLTVHRLTELAQSAARWVKRELKTDKDGDEYWVDTEIRPPSWAIQTIIDRNNWPFAPLRGLTETPFVRLDGTVVADDGYDPATGYHLALQGIEVKVHDEVGLDDAQAAYGRLEDLLQDFPFEGPAHRAGAISAILTLVARPIIGGPVPLFLVTSSTPGSGKSLLVDVIHAIGVGRKLQRTAYPDKEEELEKRITSILMASHAAACWDNIDSAFGGAALDALITSDVWMGRELGRSKMVTCPARCVWFATGNNIRLKGDMARRVIPIRIEPGVEHPEDRTDFAVPKILAHVHRNRGRILTDALTILRAFCRQGRPRPAGGGFGSFEDWNDIVRGAVLWCGGDDPYVAAKAWAVEADEKRGMFEALAAAWFAAVGTQPTPLANVLEISQGQGSSRAALREALQAVAGRGGVVDKHLLGNRLRREKGRVFAGFRFESPPETVNGSKQWACTPVR